MKKNNMGFLSEKTNLDNYKKTNLIQNLHKATTVVIITFRLVQLERIS